MDINFAVKDSIGGWKDNAFVLKTPKACSSLKIMLANKWTPIMTSLGYNKNVTCPLPMVWKFIYIHLHNIINIKIITYG